MNKDNNKIYKFQNNNKMNNNKFHNNKSKN